MKDAKKIYDSIQIPDELSERVERAIASAGKGMTRKQRQKRRFFRVVKTMSALAASFLLCLTVGVNSSYVLAQELGNVPVLGALAQVLTVRSYDESTGDMQLTAQVPMVARDTVTDAESAKSMEAEAVPEENEKNEAIVSGSAQDTDSYVSRANEEISFLVDEFIREAKEELEYYKEAFFSTGGTEEEWAERGMDVFVDYEVMYQEGPYLSLVLRTEKDWVASYQENIYYNMDLEKNRDITLEDLLGENYVDICNAAIVQQIEKEIAEDEGNIYFGYGSLADDMTDEKFSTVTSETSFYINAQGNPVICFERYEIAPGYMGIREFEVVRE